MKIIAMPIEVIAWFGSNGDLRPLRFKYIDKKEEKSIVVVSSIIDVETTCRAGQEAIVFTCESVVNDLQRVYQLRYTLSNHTWVLYKI